MAVLAIGGVALLAIFAYTLHSAVCLFQNYQIARKIGVPVRIIPVDHINPLWAIVGRRSVDLLRRLPFGLGDNNITKYNYMGFEIPLRWKSHEELGDVFILCSPAMIWLYLGHPDDITSVLKRNADFPHNSELTAMLDVFGPNISTAQGANWKKMRKLMGSCFNDPTFELAWRESIVQAESLGQYWGARPAVETVDHDTRTLSLNVMSKAGFGKSYPFKGHHETQVKLKDTSLSYKEALQSILENSIIIMVLGTEFLARPWVPRPLKHLHYACTSFKAYMTDLYEKEKLASAEGRSSERNVMTSLVRASQQEKGSLSESEIYGNMFVFNFAGHDTTAHTFVWIMYFLAANPDVQDWIHEEVQHVLGGRPQEEWELKTDFPRLKRCLSVVLETLRLYSPVGMAKWTDRNPTTLQLLDGRILHVPPKTMVVASHASVQTDPRFWGSDSLAWRPSRWIQSEPAGKAHSIDDSVVFTPRRGTFLGWSDGVRDCPGRKFSQVEAVATIATVFKDWRATPVSSPGESPETARQRVLNFIEENTGQILLVQLLHPERCPLRFDKR